jgi:hypothetical protein
VVRSGGTAVAVVGIGRTGDGRRTVARLDIAFNRHHPPSPVPLRQPWQTHDAGRVPVNFSQILEVQKDAGGQGEADREGVVRAGGVADVGPPADQRHLVQVGAVQAGLAQDPAHRPALDDGEGEGGAGVADIASAVEQGADGEGRLVGRTVGPGDRSLRVEIEHEGEEGLGTFRV